MQVLNFSNDTSGSTHSLFSYRGLLENGSNFKLLIVLCEL